ncbi:Zinc finger protein [Intoshia linei]|uniref:Zinc finger protein n=1 Tax=Intoshia linei TaxID=1819745 RepID=A0A177AYB4_9BILA|nr:Zinc finger protein [Intoshia linei]
MGPIKRQHQFVTCYICNRKFTNASLPIHEPQCLIKWKRENNDLPKSKRLKTPKRPPALTADKEGKYNLDAINEQSSKIAESLLIPCKKCKRTFDPSRIMKHESICLKSNIVPHRKNLAEPAEKDVTSPPTYNEHMQIKTAIKKVEKEKPIRKAQFVTCYICGREFTSASIGIHEPQCLKKWQIENDKLPKKYRRPEPVKSKYVTLGKSKPNQEELNIMSYKAAQSNLISCKICKRTFDPSRIEKHESICQKINSKLK